MSDPAKSTGDIDDVLSSIRRLVAEQPASRKPAGGRVSGADGAQGEKLVLTPALRVSDAEDGHDQEAESPGNGEAASRGDTTRSGSPDAAGMAPEPMSGGEPLRADGRVTPPDETGEAALFDAGHGREDAHSGNAADPAAQADSDTGKDGDLTLSPGEAPVEEDETGPASEESRALEADTDTEGHDGSGAEAVTESPDAEASGSEKTALVGEDAEARAQPVGGEGWSGDMRLLDWEDRGEDAPPREDAAVASSEFEPDTGDADWPDDGADRALLDLAAVRGVVAGRGPETGDERAATGIGAANGGFTPLFSKRGGNSPAVAESHDVDSEAAGGQSDATVETPQEQGGSPSVEGLNEPRDTGGEAQEDDASHQAAPDQAAAPAEALGAEPWGREAHAGDDVVDRTDGAPDDAEASDSPDRKGDRRPDGPVIAPYAVAGEPAGPLASGDDASKEVLAVTSQETAAFDAPPETQPDQPPGEDTAALVSGLDLSPDDEGYLDEETLRRIVAEVVREELQGALGERITRNVRKLVRREIRLALAAEELD